MSCDIGMAFDLDSAKLFANGTFQRYFSYQEAIWIVATDYYMYFYLIMLSPITAIF